MKIKKDSIKFLLTPVLAGIAILVATLFAKDATVKKTMSLTEEKTVQCNSSNYADRTLDSVCGGEGYINVENNCTATPVYTYTCSSGDSGPSGNNKCTRVLSNATERHTCYASGHGGGCVCTLMHNLLGSQNTETKYIDCGSYSSCVDACSSLATSTTSSSYMRGSCSDGVKCSGASTAYTCSSGGCVGNDGNCYIYEALSCPDGYVSSSTNYTCSSGTPNYSSGKCEEEYDAIRVQTGTTYGGTITCRRTVNDTYTVIYDKNNTNAIGTTPNSIHEVGVEKNLNLNGYSLEGYVFNGWNSKPDGSGTNYTNGQSVVDLTTTPGATVTLYAKWSACPAGTYAEAGATSCSPCTGDTYTSEEGQAACFACEEGLVANPTHTGCKVKTVICEPGTYLKSEGTTAEDCEICPIGYYCPGGEYIPSYEDQGEFLCPANHIDGEPGTILEEYCKIECPTGTYKDEVYANACIKCPEGKTSSAHIVNYDQVSPDGTCYSKSKPVDPSNPKTGLFEVGGALIGVLGLSSIAYIILKKRKIINI